MVQYKDRLIPRKLLTAKQENREIKKQYELDDDKFLICDDCRHNCITYDPSNNGTCLCECHVTAE